MSRDKLRRLGAGIRKLENLLIPEEKFKGLVVHWIGEDPKNPLLSVGPVSELPRFGEGGAIQEIDEQICRTVNDLKKDGFPQREIEKILGDSDEKTKQKAQGKDCKTPAVGEGEKEPSGPGERRYSNNGG